MNTGDKCYIVTTEGQYCKLNEHNDLVIARDHSEAVLFPRQEAETRIGKGRKSRFYHIEAAPLFSVEVAESSAPKPEVCENTATMFEGGPYDWENMLSNLCYMSSHIAEYQTKLHEMQSDVDLKISDVMHYLEFENPDDESLLTSARTLQKLSRERREIKDELEKTNLIRGTFLDKAFGNKVQQALGKMERMKSRQYTPRKLTDLFTQHQEESA